MDNTTNTPLSNAQKEEKRKLKIKKLEVQLKQLKAKEAKQVRKVRTHQLIEIGAIISQFHDRDALLQYLKNPQYLTLNTDTNKISISNHINPDTPCSIYIPPNIAPKLDNSTNPTK
jgi:hypothetical protein